jgi:hypothetical protein
MKHGAVLFTATVFIAAVLVLLLDGGAPGTAAVRPPRGGILTIAVGRVPLHSEPLQLASPEDGWIRAQETVPLFRQIGDSAQPGLAYGPEFSADHRVFRFKLRPGGITPEEVRDGLLVMGEAAGHDSPHAWLLENVGAVEIEQDLFGSGGPWIRLDLSLPDTTIIRRLASLACPIEPRPASPVPSARDRGPFELLIASPRVDRPGSARVYRLEARRTREGPPYLDGVVLEHVPRISKRLASLDLGGVDGVVAARADWKTHWEERAPTAFHLWDELLYLAWNPRSAASRDATLRTSVLSTLLPAGEVLGPWGRDRIERLWSGFIETAPSLGSLEAVPSERPLRLLVPKGNRRWEFYAERIQLRLRSGGFPNVRLLEVDAADYGRRLDGDDYELGIRAWSPRVSGGWLELRDFLTQLEVRGLRPLFREGGLMELGREISLRVLGTSTAGLEEAKLRVLRAGWFVPLLWQHQDLVLAPGYRGTVGDPPHATLEDLWKVPEGEGGRP